ncbi:MAG: BolA/IbaG family iron-sulfur metabolism protein [Cyanobacteriota bacterium]|nr:BolA/IbaG family iron-sulfur metabolism protein [Cyanobacteriota bacterium]
MQTEEIRQLIQRALPGSQVQVQDMVGDGNHFQAIVVAEAFAGLSMIQQHRLINEALKAQLDSGQLHALSLKTYAPDQWQRVQGSL